MNEFCIKNKNIRAKQFVNIGNKVYVHPSHRVFYKKFLGICGSSNGEGLRPDKAEVENLFASEYTLLHLSVHWKS